MDCGAPIDRPLPGDRQRFARIAGAAPVSLAARMRSAPVSGERKLVTAVFGDVVGSTTLAESMDPEDWVGIMNRAFELMSEALYRYEGTIASLIGDGILAFFGAPVAHEDDPERATLAALDMVDSVSSFGAELRESTGLDFQIRVGINTGEVVVGNVGSDLHFEYTALGDTMNVAARMESAAPHGGVLIAAATHRFIADLFDTEDRGEISVKGKSQPVHAYRVVGSRAAGKRTRGVAGLRSPMVGRDAELEELLAQVALVEAGGTGAAVVTAEAGLGKSRLLAELRSALRQSDSSVGWVEGQCLSYGQSVPYHVVIDILRSLWGVALTDDDDALRRALHDRADRLPAVADEPAAAYLAHLMALPQDPAVVDRIEALDPAILQGRYVTALAHVLAAESRRRPLVVAAEDVHWIDPSSARIIERLMGDASLRRVLWVLTRRPDGPPAEPDVPDVVEAASSTFGDAAHEIVLSPLSGDESRRLVANLLEIEELPRDVREVIQERSDGNPYFVEEVIRVLIDRGLLERREDSWVATASVDRLDIPDNLHGLLLARIDLLPKEARHALLVASVIGRRFPVRVLERVLEPASA
jgi:class 3 adenylate cyclase